jgi:hypothetical protein
MAVKAGLTRCHSFSVLSWFRPLQSPSSSTSFNVFVLNPMRSKAQALALGYRSCHCWGRNYCSSASDASSSSQPATQRKLSARHEAVLKTELKDAYLEALQRHRIHQSSRTDRRKNGIAVAVALFAGITYCSMAYRSYTGKIYGPTQFYGKKRFDDTDLDLGFDELE